ncbi:hypothetical protein P2116_004955 [Klebsiella quasipneumoniae]|uniref:hypothetical protein n=1 Tax=Klebsiella pneumoniae complex TaxID=3390273 RepID=UPI0010840BC1|nr:MULTISPECIES: hypothetical protein [Klebsiella]EKW2606471.1 hypothetical protein [Klebsiella quasipneumoniae]VAS22917.1 ComEC family competence protein [Klebsiella variicola]VFZ44242.1 ComEC family competence protein [Klebsiella quasipneumoniae]HBR5480326.1 hypothetical protein [Klebsiella pneumoniae]
MSITIYNVKQGDSFLINNATCFSGVLPLLVDTGCGKFNIHRRVFSSLKSERFSILITHSHRDHMGGLKDILTNPKCDVEEVFIPWYLPEILEINKILKKKFAAYNSLSLPSFNSIKLSFLGEGDNVYKTGCDNYKVLNPPKNADQVYEFLMGGEAVSQTNNVESVIVRLNELGFDVDIRDVIDYSPEITPDAEREIYREEARKFVIKFFTTMSGFVFGAKASNIKSKVREHLELLSNHTSIVFKYNCVSDGLGWIFTGDADTKAFSRIMNGKYKNYLKADVLKVPHHGSKENLDSVTLGFINPEFAIVSHDNFKGKGLDRHPHQEVIDLLNITGVDAFYTNDVKKNNKIIVRSSYSQRFSGLFKF